MIKGTTQRIPVASDPAGARVAVDGRPSGTTPTTITLDRKHSHMVSLELAGYDVENVAITNSVGGAVAGNILVGGLIGWGVDATSGAQYNLHPETVSVKLRPKSSSSLALPPVSSLDAQLARLEEMHHAGKLSDDEYAKIRDAVVKSFSGSGGVH